MEKFKPAVRFGVIWGALTILLFLIQWALMPDSFASTGGWISQLVIHMLALPIVFMILGARDCKPNFEFYSFKNAFSAAITTAVVATLIGLVFNFIFLYGIDAGFEDRLKDQVMSNLEERFEGSSMEDEQIDKILSDTEQRFEDNKGILGKVKQSSFGLIWYFIIALIVGAVQKSKKEPSVT